jgi:outer membrane protein TolC
MKRSNHSGRAAITISEVATLLWLTFVLTGCNKKEAVPSAEKAVVPEIAALEKEERLLVEGIIRAKAEAVLAAEAENVEEAERALARAIDRYEVGACPQIDVLNAQTALTVARGSYVDALRKYSVAPAALVGATGKVLRPLKP